MGKRAKKKATFEWSQDGEEPVRVVRATRREKKALDAGLVPLAKQLLALRPAERKLAPISDKTRATLEETLRIKKGARIAKKRSTDLLVGMLRSEDTDALSLWLGNQDEPVHDGSEQARTWLARFLENRSQAIKEFQDAFPDADPHDCRSMRQLANQAVKAPTGQAAKTLLALIEGTLSPDTSA